MALAISVLMLAAMLGTLFEKNLVGTLSQHGWGRTLQGVGAALTKRRCGVGGFVIDKRVDTALRKNGFTDDAGLLAGLGEAYPQNLQDTKLLQNALDSAQRLDCTSLGSKSDANGHYPYLTGFSGEDAGTGSYTRLAFAIFGVNLPGLTYVYLVILLFSLALFTISHGGNGGAMVSAALVIVALYLVVCSPLLNLTMSAEFHRNPGIDIKDPRFLGTIAALPLLHVIVTWMRRDHALTILDYLILAVQSAVLGFALHLRLPVLWTMLALPLLWAVLAVKSIWRSGSIASSSRWRLPRSVFVLATVCAIPIACQGIVDLSLHPFYAAEGDIARHTFWDGVLQSLEDNPGWTAKYGASVDGATSDEMPVAVARIAIAKLPPDQRQRYLNSDGSPTRIAYENFSKAAFIDLLSRDPGFVLYTFLVPKPLLIFDSAETMYRSLWAALQGWHLLIAIAALLVLGWLAASDEANSLELLCAVAGAALVCALVACVPNWLVTVNALVMIDSFTWGLFLLCSAPVILAVAFWRLARSEPAGALVARCVRWRGSREVVPEFAASLDAD